MVVNNAQHPFRREENRPEDERECLVMNIIQEHLSYKKIKLLKLKPLSKIKDAINDCN